MRPRGGGVGPNRPSRAQRPAARPVYEDFRPVSERHQEEEAEKLLIFLPGFMKENIRVSTEGKNIVRVRGERFIGGNKWHRFQEDFQAPDDCNMRGIHAKFENGILIITMPWKMPKQSLDEHTKQTPHKDDNVPPKTTHPTVETPRKPTPLKPTAQLPKPQNAHKDDQDSRVKEKQIDEKKFFDEKGAESSKTQKGDEDIDFPALTTIVFGKTSGERGNPKDETKTLEGLAGSIEPKIQKRKQENLDQNITQLVKSGKEVEKERHEAGGKKIAEKIQEVGQKGSKEKESPSSVAASTSSTHDSISNLKKSLVDLNEERQLLVNAGAAVLVIMALGAYIYHSIGSGRAE